MSFSPNVTAVVVGYNTREHLLECLRSLDGATDVIVVDNASRDGSADAVAAEFPSVHHVRNERNVGFGAAANQGIALATGDAVLVMNADVRAEPGAIALLASAFSEPEVVAAGPRLLAPDESTQPSTAERLTLWAVFCEQTTLEKLVPNSRLLSPYWNTRRLLATWDGAPDSVLPTPQVMGACMLLRLDARFDERFRLYCEDTDLCLRLARHGRIVYVPASRFHHALGASSESDRWRAIALYNRGKELYFFLHRGPLAGCACFVIDRFGALLRLLVAGRSRRATWWRVLTAPRRGPSLAP